MTAYRWAGRIARIAAIVLLSAGAVRAERLQLVTGDDYAPFTGQTLPKRGLATEIVQTALREMGHESTVTFRPWKRGYAETLSGRYFATFPYGKNETREAEFFYSKPLYIFGLYFFARADSDVEFKEDKDLQGQKVCMPLGFNPVRVNQRDLCITILDSLELLDLVLFSPMFRGVLMDLFLREATERIGADDALARIDALLDWPSFLPILKRGLGRSGVGPHGYDPLVLFRCLLIGQWHGLSDPKPERALKVRLDFMIFCGLDLHAPVPDETTHCRFRNALVRGGVYDDLLAEVCRQIEDYGLKLKAADAAIIDATLVESAARPRTHIDAPEDRAEGDAPDDPKMHFSADPDARRVRKGSRSTLGCKAFVRTDEEGFVDKVHTTPANQAESPQSETMIEGASAQRVPADKACASKANRASLHGKHRDGILRKAARNRPLRASEKRFNKLISKRRFRVEQCFGTMKRLFGLHRARYFGVARTHAQLAMAAIGQNLLKAANKITLNPQTLAIA